MVRAYCKRHGERQNGAGQIPTNRSAGSCPRRKHGCEKYQHIAGEGNGGKQGFYLVLRGVCAGQPDMAHRSLGLPGSSGY
eukprot:1267310-Amorphochlora_amoeboformis.AAC.2